jgi:hypothetical protein
MLRYPWYLGFPNDFYRAGWIHDDKVGSLAIFSIRQLGGFEAAKRKVLLLGFEYDAENLACAPEKSALDICLA